jgi:hypothetical protein
MPVLRGGTLFCQLVEGKKKHATGPEEFAEHAGSWVGAVFSPDCLPGIMAIGKRYRIIVDEEEKQWSKEKYWKGPRRKSYKWGW